MQEKERRSKGGQKTLGATPIRCGCGFTTTSPTAWAEHRKGPKHTR